MRNALAHVSKGQHTVVAAAIRQAFEQPDRKHADETWRHVANQLRGAASLGYRLTPTWSVMATVEHYSNAGLCAHNRGLTSFGLRMGYTF